MAMASLRLHAPRAWLSGLQSCSGRSIPAPSFASADHRAYASQPRWRRSWQQQRSKLNSKVQAMISRRRRNVENGMKQYTRLRAQFEPSQPTSATARWNKLLAGNGHDVVVQAALRHHYSDLHSQPQAIGASPYPLNKEAHERPLPSRLEEQLASETIWTVPNVLTLSRMVMTPFIGRNTGEGGRQQGRMVWVDGVACHHLSVSWRSLSTFIISEGSASWRSLSTLVISGGSAPDSSPCV